MIRRPPRSTLFPTRRSSDLMSKSLLSNLTVRLQRYFLSSADMELLVGQSGMKGNRDRKSTRLNSSHANISYAVFCLKKKKRRQLKATKKSQNKTESA